jgi:adenylate cyclase
MNSSEVFALRQLLSRLEAPTKTIGRELLMTEAVTRHLSQDVEHLGEHKSRGVAARVSVYGVFAPFV